MSIKLNHTIVFSRDNRTAATSLTEILGLPAPTPFGPFLTVQMDNEIALDFYTADREIVPQHYAFLVSTREFDEILGRIQQRGLSFWADPFHQRANEINTNDGGRGVYFEDPSGHNLEVMTASTHRQDSQTVYRIDKFNVPLSARSEFIDKVRTTHEFLRTLPGSIEDTVFEQIGGPGELNFVTIAVWETAEAIEAAGKAVIAQHEKIGFNPHQMFAKLGIKADLANYQKIDI